MASSSGVILDFEWYKDGHNWDEIADFGFYRNHKADGKTLYGSKSWSIRSHRGLKLARRLYYTCKTGRREKPGQSTRMMK